MKRFFSFEEMASYYAQKTPNAIAFIYDCDGKKTTISYSEFFNCIKMRAQKLKDSGKSNIGIIEDGSLSCIIEIFAANMAGLTVVMFNSSMDTSSLRSLIPFTDVDMLWSKNETPENLASVFAPSFPCANKKDKILFFTSGTTTKEKAVVLSGKSLCSSAYNGASLLPLSDSDILMCMLPLSHVFGFVCGVLWGFSSGVSVALGRGQRHYVDDLSFFEPTVLSAVPMLLAFLLQHNLINKNLKMVLVGAGTCKNEILQKASALGLFVSYGYGLTETSSGVALSIQKDFYGMTICPDDKISIAPDGEILIECPTCIMESYYKDDGATKNVLHDGIFYTGDIGKIIDGKLYITGRKKEILVLSDGTKIFLPEYEEELTKVLGISDLIVTLKNERPVLIYNGSIKKDEVLEKIKTVMEQYPRNKQIVDVIKTEKTIPRTATGKKKRWEIDATFIEEGKI